MKSIWTLKMKITTRRSFKSLNLWYDVCMYVRMSMDLHVETRGQCWVLFFISLCNILRNKIFYICLEFMDLVRMPGQQIQDILMSVVSHCGY